MPKRRDVLKLAAGVAAAAGDIPAADTTAQRDRLVAFADRDDDERWSYATTENYAHVRSGLFHTELDALTEVLPGVVETYHASAGQIPLSFQVEADGHGSVGVLVNLTPEQAEGLAVDLLEQAHAARLGEEVADE